MEKFGIGKTYTERRIVHVMRHTGHYLMKHDIYTAHILTLKCAEIVTCTVSKATVGVHILNDMTDIHNTVIATPITELIAEASAP